MFRIHIILKHLWVLPLLLLFAGFLYVGLFLKDTGVNTGSSVAVLGEQIFTDHLKLLEGHPPAEYVDTYMINGIVVFELLPIERHGDLTNYKPWIDQMLLNLIAEIPGSVDAKLVYKDGRDYVPRPFSEGICSPIISDLIDAIGFPIKSDDTFTFSYQYYGLRGYVAQLEFANVFYTSRIYVVPVSRNKKTIQDLSLSQGGFSCHDLLPLLEIGSEWEKIYDANELPA